jgi:hypothetical protein
MKKTVYTLCIDNYAPEVTALTFPLMKKWASKIGADFRIIAERKYSDYPVVYEKFQIKELAKQNGDEWSIYFDADTLIHPDFWDVTVAVSKDTTVSGIASDFTPQRFKPDKYFLRDGRFIGKGNWCLMASDWCTDIWTPLEDLTLEEAIENITTTEQEKSTGFIEPSHLIDDYVTSRNIAKYGLKHKLITDIEKEKNMGSGYIWHHYLFPIEKKIIIMKKQLLSWATTLLNYKLPPQQIANITNMWEGSPTLSEYLLAVPEGNQISKIIESWGIKV